MGRVALVLLALAVLVAAPASTRARGGEEAAAVVSAQPKAAQPHGAAEPGTVAEGGTAEGEHEPGLLSVIARLTNFAILVWTLVYLLRSPLAGYLQRRSTQIRGDLVMAAEMRESAAAQMAEIDRRLKALPAEIDALKARGAEQAAAEEARIQQAAEAERQRLLEQARREIDLQLRIAKRDLVRHAAELAVGVAEERVKNQITTDDQLRLVDRYVEQVKRA